VRRILLTFLLLTAVCSNLDAQFRSTRNDVSGNQSTGAVTGPPGSVDPTAPKVASDTTAVTDSLQGFSFKRLFRGYARRDTLTPGYMFLGAAIVPGAGQIYNRDYWKIPVIYAGIGTGVTGAILANKQYQKTGEDKYKYLRTAGYVTAGLFYWGQLLDATICYKTNVRIPVPAKSTIYSILLPGLGQANNGDWWKIPIWTGGLIGCGYAYHFNDMQYRRFRYIVQMDSNKAETGYTGAITGEQAKVYRDLYRRYRDYSILAAVVVYALNIIDANVFAFMSDFDVNDNIAWLEVQPGLIQPVAPQLASFDNNAFTMPAVGLNMHFTF